LDAAIAAGFTMHLETVSGPTGLPVKAAYATRGHEAVIELAQASGLALLSGMTLDPLGASSFGAGQLIRAALNRGCTEIIIGAGGSASADGGAGLLVALGAEFLDARGRPVALGGAALGDIARVNLEGLDELVQSARFVLASDVDHPLLGLHGAAAVFGPQKGASEQDVKQLESSLAHFAQMLEPEIGPRARDAITAPGAGSAGGVGYGLMAVLAARRESGVELVHHLTGFEHRLAGADLLISGEGRLDHQSLGGKAAVGTAKAAMARGIPVVAVCGSTSLTTAELHAAGISRAYSLRDLEPNLQRCLENAPSLLEATGRILANDLQQLQTRESSTPSPATTQPLATPGTTPR
jgi:glycerate kinase